MRVEVVDECFKFFSLEYPHVKKDELNLIIAQSRIFEEDLRWLEGEEHHNKYVKTTNKVTLRIPDYIAQRYCLENPIILYTNGDTFYTIYDI